MADENEVPQGSSSGSVEPIYLGDRGFAQFGEPVETDYGHSVRIKESSAMRDTDMCWMFVSGESHINLPEALPDELQAVIEKFMPMLSFHAGLKGRATLLAAKDASAGVHMTPEQVRAIRDRMTAWLANHGYE